MAPTDSEAQGQGMPPAPAACAERERLEQDARREANWKRWGPYLAERQWGTVREDYSADGNCWDDFPHDHARSRAYRWGEDGLLGFTDRECRLCFAAALWNGRDPILKERLFGLGNREGNHGEDCKELYYYLDATPTYAYCAALYKYPQAEYPYRRLVEENARRGYGEPEFEIADAGVFDGGRYFDVLVEYAKAGPDDVCVRISAANRGPVAAPLHLLPTLWFRNTWIWGCEHEGCTLKPAIRRAGPAALAADHQTLGRFFLHVRPDPAGLPARFLFTENESNTRRLWNTETYTPYVKDAFHACVVNGRADAVNPREVGTKAAAWFRFDIPPGETRTVLLRLHAGPAPMEDPFAQAQDLFAQRRREADAFYDAPHGGALGADERLVRRQAYAGLLWSRQFYHYSVADWLRGDPQVGRPPARRWSGRNAAWRHHLFNRDVVSVPDKWEYPWYASWDLAFHAIPFARLDPEFAKSQLLLLLREWYMHPNGQIPAYEFAFGDANPPVHAWACWRVYKMSAARGCRDVRFLERAFHKLLINFTWWVNRKDPQGRNLFGGGFLGLDNIGVFDRSRPPEGGELEQADATAWMSFYCLTMLSIALELAACNPAYEDVASKFFEHFVSIADAMNSLGGSGLWDDGDGFYYDQLRTEDGAARQLRIRSLVGIVPLCSVEVLDGARIDALPGFKRRTDWFLTHRRDLARHVAYMECRDRNTRRMLLAIPSRERLLRVLAYLFDEAEFLSPFGIRSLSRHHARHPFSLRVHGRDLSVRYEPGESASGLFGGNSNWRGPVWLPLNFLVVEALQRYHYYYGDSLTVEFPTGSGQRVDLREAARRVAARLCSAFLADASGRRPVHGGDPRYADDPAYRDLVLFYENLHGETGRGCGASHQTGWTALAATLLENLRKDARGRGR